MSKRTFLEDQSFMKGNFEFYLDDSFKISYKVSKIKDISIQTSNKFTYEIRTLSILKAAIYYLCNELD
jgi:hypothetical protein